ncbi:hypothetical protein VPH35_048837 [Triticum aestivum]|uniref:Uncharacterized protein n=1 Tax=Triticum aestivum TaxID=4565 RepID=A0A077RRP7_WHEAT|nr:unnamed protein product [Triticum aestivum]
MEPAEEPAEIGTGWFTIGLFLWFTIGTRVVGGRTRSTKAAAAGRSSSRARRLLSSDHAAVLRDGEWAPALPVRELVPGHGGGSRALLLRPRRVLESGGAADGGGRLRRRHLLRPARLTPGAHFPSVVAVIHNHRHRAPTLSPSLQAPTFSQSPHPSLPWPVDSPLVGSIPPSQRSAWPDGSGAAPIGASVAMALRVEADPQRRWRCVKPARASARGTTWLSGDEMLVHLLLTDQIVEDSSSIDAPKPTSVFLPDGGVEPTLGYATLGRGLTRAD